MPTRKKILYVASTSSHLRQFHEPYLAALRERFDVRTMAAGDGVDFSVPFRKSMFSPRNIGAVRRIRKICRAERFEAVVVNTSLAAALVRFALRRVKPRPRVLNVVHGYLFSDPPQGLRDRFLLWVERKLAKQTDAIAVMNAHDLAAAQKNRLCGGEVRFLRGMGLPPAPIPEQSPELRRLFAAPKDLLLTFVGELSRRKNQAFLIRSVARLREEGIPVRLLLVGEGRERKQLIRTIGKYGLGEAVFLVGRRDPVLPYLGVTDLYVSASRSEGLPFNIMEAMQCGLPILASAVRGQEDLLPAERLYPLDDADAFCAAVRRFWERNEPRGVGAVSYPNLNDYMLSSVFEENLKTLQIGGFL